MMVCTVVRLQDPSPPKIRVRSKRGTSDPFIPLVVMWDEYGGNQKVKEAENVLGPLYDVTGLVWLLWPLELPPTQC